jgi:poly(A) polymerase
MFPATEQELSQDDDFMKFVRAALKNTDHRVASGKSVTPMFLLGVFFWVPVRKLAEIRRSQEKMSETQSLSLASYDIVARQQSRISIPRRFTAPMREMLALQPRFAQMRGKRGMKLLEHRRFRAAYDFMVLLAKVGQVDANVAQFWTDVQTQSATERAASFQMNAKAGKKRRPRSRRRRKKPQES